MSPAASPPERIHDPQRIVHVLNQLQARRAPLTTKVAPLAPAASTMVLAVDPQRAAVMLDAPFPASARYPITSGLSLGFAARLDGVGVQGSLRVRLVETHDGDQVLWADLPRELLWSQRRAAYRVPVAQLPPSQLKYDGTRYRARVLDLSVLGLGASVVTDQPLAPGQDALWELQLRDAQVVAPVRICSAVPAGGLVRIGGRYLELSPSQRMVLQRTVTALQRQELQRQHGR